MKRNLKVAEIAGLTTVALGGVIWWFFLRKRVVDVHATVTVPQDEVSVTYRPTVP